MYRRTDVQPTPIIEKKIMIRDISKGRGGLDYRKASLLKIGP